MSNGLEYLDKLQIGMPELQWLQDEILNRLQDQFAGLVANQEYGWNMRWTTAYEADVGWRVRNLSGGRLQVQTQEAFNEAPYHPGSQRRAPRQRYTVGVDQDGRPMMINVNEDGNALRDSGGAEISVPDDGVWRTLVAKYTTTRKESGTLTLTAASVTVTGVGTEFTRLTDGSDPRAMLLRIDSTDSSAGNEGFYRVATITDDENMTLATPPPATESGVPFRVQGEFFGGTPADPDIHNTPEIVWELVTRTTTPPADGLIYGDVKYDSGASANVQVVDRRFGQIMRQRDPNIVGLYLTAPFADPSWLDKSGVIGSGNELDYIAASHCRGGSSTDAGTAIGGDVGPTSQLVVVARQDGTGGHDLEGRERIPYAVTGTGQPNHAAAGSDAIGNISGGITGLALCPLPFGYDNTHLLFYTLSSNGNLRVQATTDSGAAGTWSAASTVAAPSGNNTMQNPRATITRMGRVIVVFEYTDVDGTTDTSIRFVYSDDYGATWETNGGDGFVIREEPGTDLLTPDIVEVDDGTIWTAWKRGNDEIRIAKGQGLNDPTLSGLTAQQPPRGFIASQQGTAVAARSLRAGRPTLLAGPSGVLLLYQEVNTTTGAAKLYQSWVGDGRLVRVSALTILGDVSLTGSGEFYADVVAVPMPGGWVTLLWHGSSSGTGNGGAYVYGDYPCIPLYRSMDRFQGV